MESYELYSCFCLFDECCISKYKRETHKELVERLIDKKSHKMCWLVKNNENFKEKRYACCIYHVSRIMENISSTQPQINQIIHLCLRNVDGERINCFSLF